MKFSNKNPAERYILDGAFDVSGFDDDITSFPEFFDRNGWPLFGSYDPYSLIHPITLLSWHTSPRVPQKQETDHEYESWFRLAEEYNTVVHPLLYRISEEAHSTPFRDATVEGTTYKTKANVAVKGNSDYLRKHLLPRFKMLLHKRTSTIEFALLWGELRAIAESLSTSVDISVTRYKSGQGGRGNNKDAIFKWYVHWRRHYYDEKAFSIIKMNSKFCNLVFEILDGKRKPPTGFEREWFRGALTHEKRENDPKDFKGRPTRSLTNRLKRAKSDPKYAELLTASAEEYPQIPPLDISAYPPEK